MKKLSKIFALVLALFVFCALAASCDNNGSNDKNDEGNKNYSSYSAEIVDGIGTPMSDVIVKFIYPDGKTVKNRLTDENGVASLNNVPEDRYEISLEQGFSNAVIEEADYVLTPNENNLKIVVRNAEKTMEIFGEIENGLYAYNASAGEYNIPLTAESGYTTYMIFYAHLEGTYKITLTSPESGATVGYYGNPMFVQSTHRADGEYDGKTFTLDIYDVRTPYVFGIKGDSAVEVALTIERTGDAPFDPQYEPWTAVESKMDLEKLDLADGTVLSDVDICDPDFSVVLGDDGRYYTKDGKPVYVRVNSTSTSGYLDVSIAYIAGLVDQNFGQNFGGYVYDENGNFTGKYTYNEMLAEYMDYLDEGVYYLTEELAEAIKCHGNSAGWWNPNAANYLFFGVPFVEENAWLFLCCIAQ